MFLEIVELSLFHNKSILKTFSIIMFTVHTFNESNGKRIKNIKETAIPDYLLLCDCLITFNHFDIVASDSNKFKLLIKESLLIKSASQF